ncbi:MAG TPA: universal stress protein [Desulfobacteraceae bacterium]|nr:universal stress protein [Desulfobacteraceae bacterium]
MDTKIKVLVPVDFSKYSLETIHFALKLRQWAEPEYCLLHVVVHDDFNNFAAEVPPPPLSLQKRLEEASEELGKEVEQLKKENPGLRVEGKVVSGFPFKEICRIAEEEYFQLIVIGTHGRTGLAHLLIGSTAERVVQHAPCPVLSIKPRVL